MKKVYVNKKLLVARMIELGITRDYAAETLEISRTALENKLNGDSEFKASEIAAFSSLLGVSKQKDKYFFCKECC